MPPAPPATPRSDFSSHRAAYRGAAVDHDLKIASGRLALGARLHVAGDLCGIFAQRVVGGDDEKVRELGRGAAHSRSVMVRARGRPEDGDEPPLRERAQLGQRARQRAGRVREVNVNAKVLAEVDWLEPSSYSFKSSEPAADVLDLHAEREAHPRGAERVV